MKIAPAVFWGLILIFIGVSIIFKIIAGISLVRFLIGFFLIFIGLLILFGKNIFISNRINNFFNNQKISFPEDGKEYNVVFGKNRFDFSQFKFNFDEPVKITINTVFGYTEVKVPVDIPLKIKINAVFSEGRFPDKSSVVFGSTYYTSPSFNKNTNYFYIEGNVVFGDLIFKNSFD